jgi:cytidylate kinase
LILWSIDVARQTLKRYIKENSVLPANKASSGPFVTISREFGCSGYELADILASRLNELAEGEPWQVYGNEIVRRLAEESGFSVEAIKKARTEKAGFINDILKNVRTKPLPDSFQVRSQIAVMVRKIANQGHAIIVGQGGAAATADIKNGLSVRIEAPESWRLQRVCMREEVDKEQARRMLKEVGQSRAYLRDTYQQVNPKVPVFNITLDNSMFTPEQVSELIILAMRHRGMTP